MLKRRHRYTDLISQVFEAQSFNKIILKVMQRWVGRLIRLQNEVKRFILNRRKYYLMGKNVWMDLEKRTNIDVNQTTPEKVKEFLLCKEFRKRVKTYLKKEGEYRREEMRVKEVNKDRLLEAEANKVAGLMYEMRCETVTLPRPSLRLTVSAEECKTLISLSISMQADWGVLLKAMMSPVHRASPTFHGRRKTRILAKSDSAETLLRVFDHVKLSYGLTK